MKDLRRILILLLVLPILAVTSCKDDEPVENDDDSKFATLKTYLVDNDMDLSNVLDGWITTATVVNDNIEDGDATNDYYIMDLRAASDYNDGHITGAVNVTLANVLTEAENANGKPIIMVCYTGQTAGHANCALRLMGYESQVLKWGMSGWNPATSGPWDSNIGDAADGNSNWIAPPGDITANVEFDDPTLDVTATTGEEILAERVQAMLDGGFNGVTNADVLGNPSDYFINNYWALSDVEHYGHIKGAYRIKPLTLADGEYKNLDPSKTVVTYCWTGQTSSMVTAYLKVIGYDSKSLKFGANGMIHTTLESHKWTSSPENFTLETK